MFALYLMFISCSEKDSQEPIEVSEEESQEENQEENQEDTENTEEEENTEQSHGVCTPQPNIQTQDLGFDVFQKMLEVEELSCSLEIRDIDTNNDGQSDASEEFSAPSSTTDCEDENNCVQILPSFAVSWSQSSYFDLNLYTHGSLSEGIVEGERIITDGIERIALRIAYNIYGNTAHREIERIYSPEGNILEERFYFNEMLWFEVHNNWESDHLISQDLYDYINTSGQHTNLSWNYDDEGRMIQSRHASEGQQVSTGVFRYDDEGRLVSLTRDVDGEVRLTQNWSYENGELISRSSEYLPNAQWFQSADNAKAQTVWDYSSHWNSSIPTTDTNCTNLPYSIIHGYPDEERVYQLGWQRNDVPNNIGFSYQYDGYGWNYGTQSWFGHMGVASTYEAATWTSDTMLKNTINYQNGIMTHEVLTALHEEESQFSITRTRTFEDNLMIRDEVINTHVDDETLTAKYTLDFSYDEQGNLQTRDLHQDEVHTHHNTWTYNDQGLLTGHTISMQLFESDELQLVASYRQTTTETEDSYIRIREKRGAEDEEWEMIDQLRRGEHAQGRYEMHDYGYVIFNEDNRVIMQGYGDIDTPTYYSSAVENQNGLLETWTKAEYEEVTTHHYQYTCD